MNLKLILKILGGLIGVLILLFVGAILYVKFALPNVGPPPDIEVELTDARIERGDYLVNNVMLCTSCHSVRHEDVFTMPPKEGYHGAGGTAFLIKRRAFREPTMLLTLPLRELAIGPMVNCFALLRQVWERMAGRYSLSCLT